MNKTCSKYGTASDADLLLYDMIALAFNTNRLFFVKYGILISSNYTYWPAGATKRCRNLRNLLTEITPIKHLKKCPIAAQKHESNNQTKVKQILHSPKLAAFLCSPKRMGNCLFIHKLWAVFWFPYAHEL